VLTVLREHLEAHLPAGATLRYDYELPGCCPIVTSTEHPALTAALDALGEVYGVEPVVFRTGGSVPVVEIISRLLNLDSVLLGFFCPDECFHAPNEFMRLDNFDRGIKTVTRWWRRLGA